MSSSSRVEKKITLMSSDGVIFEVENWVAMESQTIKHMLEVNCSHTMIRLPNMTSPILSKVIEYCKKHADAMREKMNDVSSDEELKSWDCDFVKVDDNTIWDLSLAANYLNIQSLIDLTAQNVYQRVNDPTLPETHLQNHFPPEEEEETIRRWGLSETSKEWLVIWIVTVMNLLIGLYAIKDLKTVRFPKSIVFLVLNSLVMLGRPAANSWRYWSETDKEWLKATVIVIGIHIVVHSLLIARVLVLV